VGSVSRFVIALLFLPGLERSNHYKGGDMRRHRASENTKPMKTLAFTLILASTATLAAVACGDSDSDNGGGKGGSSGTSGAAGNAGSGVTGGAAGSSAGTPATGGASGAVTGGTAGGGMSGTSGTGGSGNDGGVGAEGGMTSGGEGGGGPVMGCPASEPTPMTMCGSRGLSCDFGDRVCRCNLTTGNWQCFDENGNCPGMRDPGGNCMGGGTACSYGEDGTCVCMGGNFTCDAGEVSCPAARPMDGAGCNMFPAGFACDYAAGNCTCMGAGGGGMRNWNCQDSACPNMAPMNGSGCPTPGLICDYTTPGPAPDPTCVCNTMSQWTCL
jgi:hypothetical protein